MAEIPQNSFQGPLAPKIGLNDSMSNPIPGGGAKIPKRRNYSGLIPVGFIALALLIVPLTVQQLSHQQNTQQNASQPTPTIVVPTSTVQTPTPTSVLDSKLLTPTVTATPSVSITPSPTIKISN